MSDKLLWNTYKTYADKLGIEAEFDEEGFLELNYPSQQAEAEEMKNRYLDFEDEQKKKKEKGKEKVEEKKKPAAKKVAKKEESDEEEEEKEAPKKRGRKSKATLKAEEEADLKGKDFRWNSYKLQFTRHGLAPEVDEDDYRKLNKAQQLLLNEEAKETLSVYAVENMTKEKFDKLTSFEKETVLTDARAFQYSKDIKVSKFLLKEIGAKVSNDDNQKFGDLNLTQLKYIAQQYNLHTKIEKYSKLRKDDLIGEMKKYLYIDGNNVKILANDERIKIPKK